MRNQQGGMTVTAPCPGKVADLSAQLNTSYPVGTTSGHWKSAPVDGQGHGSGHRLTSHEADGAAQPFA